MGDELTAEQIVEETDYMQRDDATAVGLLGASGRIRKHDASLRARIAELEAEVERLHVGCADLRIRAVTAERELEAVSESRRKVWEERDAAIARAEKAEKELDDSEARRKAAVELQLASDEQRDTFFDKLHEIIGIANGDDGPPEDEWSTDDPAEAVRGLFARAEAAEAREARLREALQDQRRRWEGLPSGVDLTADEADTHPEDAFAWGAGLAVRAIDAALARGVQQ